MYRAEMLDYIAGRRHMPYNEFKEFKDTNGLGARSRQSISFKARTRTRSKEKRDFPQEH